MYIRRNNDVYVAARVSGPLHNWLELTLEPDSGGADRPIACEELPPVGGCVHKPLGLSRIRQAILEGVARGNASASTRFAVTHIRYVGNDTPPEDIYGIIAEEILNFAAKSLESELS